MYNIETNIPLPNVNDGRGRKKKYPFTQMKIGDSFFVPNNKIETVRASLYNPNNKNNLPKGSKFKILKVKEFRQGYAQEGVRCWRVA